MLNRRSTKGRGERVKKMFFNAKKESAKEVEMRRSKWWVIGGMLALAILVFGTVGWAQGILNVVPFTLQVMGGTAVWTDADFHTGSQSVLLNSGFPGYAGVGIEAYTGTIDAITSLSFWYKHSPYADWVGPRMALFLYDSVADKYYRAGTNCVRIDTDWKHADAINGADNDFYVEEENKDQIWGYTETEVDFITDIGDGVDSLTFADLQAALTGATVQAVVVYVQASSDEGPGGAYVDDIEVNGTTYYGMIQDAIGAAAPGDTINVAAGTYHNDIVDGYWDSGKWYYTHKIDKSVTLLGAQASVDPAGSTDRGGETILTRDDGLPYSITAPNVVIDGFMNGSATANSGGRFIIGDDADGTTIKNCIIQNTRSGSSGHGVYVYPGAVNALISHNTIANTAWEGIVNGGASGTTITQNHIIMGTAGSGMQAITCTNHAGTGIEISHNVISGVVDSQAINYWGGAGADISYNQIDGSGGTFDGIAVCEGASNSTVSHNDVANVTYAGISVKRECTNVSVTYNAVTGCGTGLELHFDIGDPDPGHHFNCNAISGNSTGMASYTSMDVDATNNWWGNASGPEHAGNTYNVGSQGDKVSDYVDYVPWLNAAYPGGTSFAPVTTDETPVGKYSSIQAAIDGVTGTTITCAAGTYDEQVVIDKSLTLQGAGDTTIIKPSQATADAFQLFERKVGSGNVTAGIIVASAVGSSVTVKDLKVDGELITSAVTGDKLVGVLYSGTAGTIDNLSIEDIGNAAIGNGDAIYLSGLGQTVTVEVKNSRAYDYWKNGITANYGTLTANIHDNSVVGMGPTDSIAQNGIQVGYGAGGTIDNCNVSGNIYTGPTWSSSGIMLYQGISVSISNCTVTNNCPGIYVEDCEGSLVGSVITNTDPDSWDAIYVRNTGGARNFDIDNCQFIGDDNKVDSWGVYFRCLEDNLTGTLTNSTVTGWGSGVYTRESGGVVDVTANQNKIYSNLTYGFESDTANTQDAEDNWWGSCGPSGEGPGTGDKVSTNVDFDPWYTDEGMTTQATMASNTYADAGWNLVSVPLQPMCTGDGDSVFDEAGQLQFRLQRYNPDTPGYDMGGGLTVNPEYGFWLYLDGLTVIDMGGTDVTNVPPVPLTTGDYWETTVDFADGWQQVGVPFTTSLMATKVSNGGAFVSMDDAMTNSWLDSQIFAWNSTTQEYGFKSYSPVDPNGWDDVTLTAWDGGWIKNKSGVNLRFKFYYDSTVQPPKGFSPKAMYPSTLWRPMSELAPGADRPPAPPVFPQGMPVPNAAAIAQNVDVMVAPNPVQQGRAVEFRVVGDMAMFVSSVSVQVYTIGGQLIFDQSTQGQTVTWGLTTLSGEPVANGLYLYVARMEFIGGQTATFNKLLILK